MDKLAAMRTFVSVVQNGGYSAAGRALGVPKTRVSQRVLDLEAELNVRLLSRTTRTVTPTEEGRVYFDKCVEIIADIDAADQAMHRSGERPEGRLHVTVMSAVAHAAILPHLQQFLAAYPAISVKISVTDRLANLVEEGIDCAIRGGGLDNSSLISRHVCDVPFGLVAAPAYLDRHPIAAIGDLDRADRLVVSSQRTGIAQPWHLTGAGAVHSVETPPRVECDDDQALLTACLAGGGVALCAGLAAAPLIQSGRLVSVLPDWRGDARPIYIVYPSRRYVAAKLRCFIDWSTRQLQASPGLFGSGEQAQQAVPGLRERWRATGSAPRP